MKNEKRQGECCIMLALFSFVAHLLCILSNLKISRKVKMCVSHMHKYFSIYQVHFFSFVR